MAGFEFRKTKEVVSLGGIEDVDDLRHAIKPLMTPELDEYYAGALMIRAAPIQDKEGDQAADLEAEDTLDSVLEPFGVVNEPFPECIGFFVDVQPETSAGKSDIWISFPTTHFLHSLDFPLTYYHGGGGVSPLPTGYDWQDDTLGLAGLGQR